MPAWRTVYDWLAKHPAFAARFAQAREVGFDAIAEEALEIANTPVIGKREESSDDGLKVTREDMLGHRKLQIETRLKLLAKWSPKKYGDSSKLELSGSLAVHDMSEDEMRAELATLTAGAAGVLTPEPEPDDVSDLV